MKRNTTPLALHAQALQCFLSSAQGPLVPMAAFAHMAQEVQRRASGGSGAPASAECLGMVRQLSGREPLQALSLAQLLPFLCFAAASQDGQESVLTQWTLEDGVALVVPVDLANMDSVVFEGVNGAVRIVGTLQRALPAGCSDAQSILFFAADKALVGHWMAVRLPLTAPGVQASYKTRQEQVDVHIRFDVDSRSVAHFQLLASSYDDPSQLQALSCLAYASLACGLTQSLLDQLFDLPRQRVSKGAASIEAEEKLAMAAARLGAAAELLRTGMSAWEVNRGSAVQIRQALFCACECLHEVSAQATAWSRRGSAAHRDRLQSSLRISHSLQLLVGKPTDQAPQLLASLQEKRMSNPRKNTQPAALPQTDQERSAKHRREFEILDAAANAFNSQGYDGASIDHIGSALGITKGSIYHHYKSKADLLVAVYQRVMEMNFYAIDPIVKDRTLAPLQRVYQLAFTHAMQVLKHLSYQRLAVQGLEAQLIDRVSPEQRAKLENIIAMRSRYQQIFVGVFQEAMDAGEIPAQNIRMSIKPFFGAINGATMWYVPRPDETPQEREKLAHQLATFVTSGLAQVVPSMESLVSG